MKKFKNRNATFELCIENKTIRKNYFSKAKNVREYKILSQKQALFTPLKLEGWSYELVKVFEGSYDDGILMNVVPGESMLEIKKFDKDYYYHADIWLGHYHSLSRNGDNVKAFGDFNFSDIFISQSENVITGLDPSGKGMSNKNYYFDILTFCKMAFINNLRKKHQYNFSCVSEFLKGYNKFGNFANSNSLFDESAEFILKDFWISANSHHSKVKAFASHLLLKFHFNYALRKWMNNFKNVN